MPGGLCAWAYIPHPAARRSFPACQAAHADAAGLEQILMKGSNVARDVRVVDVIAVGGDQRGPLAVGAVCPPDASAQAVRAKGKRGIVVLRVPDEHPDGLAGAEQQLAAQGGDGGGAQLRDGGAGQGGLRHGRARGSQSFFR